MELFIAGLTLGMIFGCMIFWNRTRRIEDELEHKSDLLDTAVEMLREERKDNNQWKEVSKECDSGDLFGKW